MLKLMLTFFIPFYFLNRPLVLYADPILLVGGKIDAVFINDVYPDNQKIEIVSIGSYPNTCYHVADPQVSVDKLSNNIFVNPQTYYSGGYCLDMITNYQQTLQIGQLAGGEYRIYDVSQKKLLGVVRVAHF